MARDFNGDEIEIGDIVRCIARYYLHIREGETFTVHNTDGRCISNNELDKRYGFDGRFLGYNFVRTGKTNPNITKLQSKGNSTMTCIAVRIDHLSAEWHLANHINAINNPAAHSNTIVHGEQTYNELKDWIEQRIKANSDERWMIFQPTHVAETSTPPVRFKSL